MRWFDWDEGQGSMPLGRVFEYTEQPLVEQFSESGQPALVLPCPFTNEGTGEEVCRVGTISHTRIVGRDVMFD